MTLASASFQPVSPPGDRATLESDLWAVLRRYASHLAKSRRTLSCPPWADDAHAKYAHYFAACGHSPWADPLFQDVLVALGALYRAPTSLFGHASAAPYAAARGLNVLFSCIDLEEPALVAFLPLMLSVFKVGCLPLADDHQRSVVRYLASEIVKPSMDAGDRRFLRVSSYDQAIAHLFPDLTPTLAHGSQIVEKGARAHSRASHGPTSPAWHAMDAPDDAFERQCVNAAEVARVFDLRWSRADDVDFEKWKRFEVVCQMPRSDARFVRDAYEARRAGVDFPAFVLDVGIPDPDDTVHLIGLMKSIFMLS